MIPNFGTVARLLRRRALFVRLFSLARTTYLSKLLILSRMRPSDHRYERQLTQKSCLLLTNSRENNDWRYHDEWRRTKATQSQYLSRFCCITRYPMQKDQKSLLSPNLFRGQVPIQILIPCWFPNRHHRETRNTIGPLATFCIRIIL
jgi:hypothetical protein